MKSSKGERRQRRRTGRTPLRKVLPKRLMPPTNAITDHRDERSMTDDAKKQTQADLVNVVTTSESAFGAQGGRGSQCCAHAADLAPVVADIRAAGHVSLRAIAVELNARVTLTGEEGGGGCPMWRICWGGCRTHDANPSVSICRPWQTTLHAGRWGKMSQNRSAGQSLHTNLNALKADGPASSRPNIPYQSATCAPTSDGCHR